MKTAQLESKETQGEKDRWELHKNAMCCFEQIMQAIPSKAANEPYLIHGDRCSNSVYHDQVPVLSYSKYSLLSYL